MPYKKKVAKLKKLSGTSDTHLLAGRCLIGFACEVCNGCRGKALAAGLIPYALRDDAKETWLRHRERLLGVWSDSEGRQKGSGFCAEGLRGGGRTGLPCWAEMKFEGAKLPKLNKLWPQDVKKIWKELKDAI